MSIVIVEGPDGAGKTTLISNLRKATKRHFITLSRNGRPRKPDDLLLSIPWIAQCPEGVDLVCDRHPLISEWIYGPHVRGEDPYVASVYSPASSIDLLGRTVGRIIYCRPPLKTIFDGVRMEEQMGGVNESISKIVTLYDQTMNNLRYADIKVLYYDWTFASRVPDNLEQLFFGDI